MSFVDSGKFNRISRVEFECTAAANLRADGSLSLRQAGISGARRFGRKTALELDQRSRKLALGSGHRPNPANPVGTQAELALQLQGRDAIGVRGHQKGRPEPGGQRQLAAVHARAGGHRGLATAGGALIGERLGLQSPGATTAATWQTNPSASAARRGTSREPPGCCTPNCAGPWWIRTVSRCAALSRRMTQVSPAQPCDVAALHVPEREMITAVPPCRGRRDLFPRRPR
jgi:hypothetical protein